MNAELVIHSSAKGVEIALLHDKILVELHREESNSQFAVGDIYLGRIRKMVPHLNATFIDVGYEKDAFLHFLDLGPHFPTINKYVRRVLGGEKVNTDLSGVSKEPELKKDLESTNIFDMVVNDSDELIHTLNPKKQRLSPTKKVYSVQKDINIDYVNDMSDETYDKSDIHLYKHNGKYTNHFGRWL